MSNKKMNKINIPKIRPASWRVYVQGEEEAKHVKQLLTEAGMDTSEPKQQAGLTEVPLYAVVAAPKNDVTLTEEELVAILRENGRLELEFNS